MNLQLERIAAFRIQGCRHAHDVIPLLLGQIWGASMGKPHPIEIRMRVVVYVDEGHGHCGAARRFRVSPKFVNELIKLRRDTGSLEPRPQGNGGGHGKLAGMTGWIEARVATKGEITLDELPAELAEIHGIDVHRGTV